MKRLPMRKIRDVLRLSAEGLSTRQIAASLAIGRTTLQGYLDRARDAELSWPLSADLSDTDLERQVYPRTARDVSNRATQPDWAHIHRDLRRKGVTLSLLWEEYRADHPDGYGYSRFCELYTRWEGKLSPVMRQRHPAGERLFVDYAGHTVDVIDPTTGEVRTAQLFVATLGALQRDNLDESVEGLKRDKTRPSRVPPLPMETRLKVITKTVQETPPNATHWSRSLMAEAMGISPSSVGRIWADAGLKPHITRGFKVSNDPMFEEKVTKIVGLYLDPPDRAVVLCVDEKSQIQALDRTQPGLA